MSLHPQPVPHPDENRVLSVAFRRAAEELGLPRRDQARLLGVSEAGVSRLVRREREIDARGKEGELALLFIRVFRSLDALVGGDAARARAWFHAQNHHLGAAPAALVLTIQGLVHVIEYLDAMRGRI